MAADNNLDAANALRAKVFKVLTGEKTPPAAFLSYAPGGLPQSEYTLSFLKDPSKTDEAFDFAAIANNVPLGVGDWVQSADGIPEVYSNWLDQYDPPPFTLTPEQVGRLKTALDFIEDSSNFDVYMQGRAGFQNAYSNWYGLVVLPKDDRPKNYAVLLASAKAAMDAAQLTWNIKGHKAQYETQYAIVQDLSQRDATRIKQNLRTKLGQPLESAKGPYYPTLITPANLLDPGFEWPRFSMFHNEIHTYSNEQSYRWGGSAGYSALLWSASAKHDGHHEYSEHKTDISNMAVEFELLRAPILRPWFSSFLLRSGGWKWPQSTREDPAAGHLYSDGKIPPERGDWPMIATEAIFVRNLKVKLDMSSSVNKESLTATQTAAEAGWGPFKIKGHVETSSGKKEFDFVEGGDGITCAQPQIVGFFCELLPLLPNPNWRLWDEPAHPEGGGSGR